MSMRVLVVDDAAYIRRLIGEVIAEHSGGWSVAAEASNGQEAVDIAATVRPDLVLLDLSMPVMDGLQALPLLRLVAPDATVIVLTGLPSAAAQEAALNAGAHGFLEKECLVTSLVPRVEAIVDRVRTGVEADQR